MEKVCTRCGILKDLLLFPARKSAKNGRASWCRACYKENWDERYYENHQHYRNSHNRSRKKHREQNARKVFEYLDRHPCINCGESDPIVLEFDHRDRNQKTGSISNLIRNASWTRIKLEIEKCDVLCANCHRRKTAVEFEYLRFVFVNV